MASRRPITALTGLRFFAAFFVVASHATVRVAPVIGDESELYILLTSASGLGMQLFFVLSGFVIQYNYAEKIETGKAAPLFNFFVARFARLYPLYFVALIYDIINSRSYYRDEHNTLNALPYYLTMTQSWFYINFGDTSLIYTLGAVPQVAWSVSTEWFFYLAYPLICLAIGTMRRTGARLFVIVAFTLVALGGVWTMISNMNAIGEWAAEMFGPLAGNGGQSSFFRWLIYFSPYSRILEFVLGCLVAEAYMKQDSVPDQRVGVVLIAVSIVWTAFWYYVFFGIASHPIPWANKAGFLHMSFGFAPGIGLFIYCCARYDNVAVRFLRSKWLVLGGEASYSLYLLHIIIVEMFSYSAAPVTTTWIGVGDSMRLAVCLIACVGASLITWRFIEVPARETIRNLLTLRRAGAVAGGQALPP